MQNERRKNIISKTRIVPEIKPEKLRETECELKKVGSVFHTAARLERHPHYIAPNYGSRGVNRLPNDSNVFRYCQMRRFRGNIYSFSVEKGL